MIIGKVIGSLWATKKDELLEGCKLMIVQPLNVEKETNCGEPIVSVDMVGAGIGETVIMVMGSSARSAVSNTKMPIDAAIVGIIDDIEVGGVKKAV